MSQDKQNDPIIFYKGKYFKPSSIESIDCANFYPNSSMTINFISKKSIKVDIKEDGNLKFVYQVATAFGIPDGKTMALKNLIDTIEKNNTTQF